MKESPPLSSKESETIEAHDEKESPPPLSAESPTSQSRIDESFQEMNTQEFRRAYKMCGIEAAAKEEMLSLSDLMTDTEQTSMIRYLEECLDLEKDHPDAHESVCEECIQLRDFVIGLIWKCEDCSEGRKLIAQRLQERLQNWLEPEKQDATTTVMTREVKLSELRAGKATAVQIAVDCLCQDGFVFLDMQDDDDNLMKSCRGPFEEAGAFLQGPARGQGSREATALHGHVSHRYKDSLRLLSGNQFQNSNCPSTLFTSMENLVKAMDHAAIDVAKALAAFGVGDSFVHDDLPLLQSKPRNGQAYGLVDLVCYHNGPVTPHVVVSAHVDPGFLILALPEMAPGLELWQRQTKQWISPPSGKGVLWAGLRAQQTTRGPVWACLHRVVVKHPGKPRVACWHEICMDTQIAQPLLDHLEQTNKELALENTGLVGNETVLEHLRQAENHGYQKHRQPQMTSRDGLFGKAKRKRSNHPFGPKRRGYPPPTLEDCGVRGCSSASLGA